ncbi:MAG TPA: hypothetical protein VK907_05310 [Phnomibacter sp.]|nr:hypothetical protein [Phnomibacter sp.]
MRQILFMTLFVIVITNSCNKDRTLEYRNVLPDRPPVITPVVPGQPANCNAVIRPVIEARLEKLTELPEWRQHISVGVAGSKVIFAGGFKDQYEASDRVDIYDTQTGDWETYRLSQPRFAICIVTAGDKVFFAGGQTESSHIGIIEILDLKTKTWEGKTLTKGSSHVSGATNGSKVVFAGGGNGNQDKMEIYDMATGHWQTKSLRYPRLFGHAVNAIGDNVYISGGLLPGTSEGQATDIIEVHNLVTGEVNELRMSGNRVFPGGAVVNNKLILAGGSTWGATGRSSCTVHVLDPADNSISLDSLSVPAKWSPNYGWQPVISGSKVIFVHTSNYHTNHLGLLEIFDVAANSWFTGKILETPPDGSVVVAVGSMVLIAAGHYNPSYSEFETSPIVYKLVW